MEEIITISNDRLKVDITNFGGRVMRWLVDEVDIVLGFDSIKEYKSANEPYHGAIIGRYANRIANAKYTYEGVTYLLDVNHGNHILHGGKQAFHNATWEVLDKSNTHVKLRHISPDGDQGFPGILTTIAKYELQGGSLYLTISATTTKATPISITHHPYFNLSGLDSNDLSHHLFQIHADQILSTNSDGIPMGDRIDVEFTGFDFANWKSLNQGIQESHPQMDLLSGIDHTYITISNAESVQLLAEAKASDTGVHMQVFSNQPGTQFYTANHFNGSDKGKGNRIHHYRGAFCFEPQMWPDSPNQKTFPNTILLPNETFLMTAEYKFPVEA